MIPETNFIRDGIREMIIKQMIISDNSTVEERNNIINNITHENISKYIPDYINMEYNVAQNFGEEFAARLLGLNTDKPIAPIIIPPVMTISDDQEISIDGNGILDAQLSGGTMNLSDFVFLWSMNYGPGNITIDNPTSNNTIIEFSETGLYEILCVATNEKTQFILRDSIQFNVYESSSLFI